MASGSGVSILLGRRDGSFAPHVDYSVGQFSPVALAVGDFNGDGELDLVTVVGAQQPSFQILVGNGDGTFQPATDFPLSSLINAAGIAVGDFNKDGKLDIAIAGATFSGPVVSVLLGNGNGTFGAEVDYPTAGSLSVVTGDFNGDGKTDLAVGGGDISILLGKGDGTFKPYLPVSVSSNGADSLAAADLNHDGKLDLVAGANGWLFSTGGTRTPCERPPILRVSSFC